MVVSNDTKVQPILELCEQEVDESSLRSSILKLVKPQGNYSAFLNDLANLIYRNCLEFWRD